MATTLHTFAEIFNKDIECKDETVQLKKIVIPIIQRDYAQGRIMPETDRVRKRFLDSLFHAVVDEPITLDFVYGDIDQSGIMTPLDGQQRLTTLFLLHWFAAQKEAIDESEWQFLRQFSYETRYSARDFCALLIDFTPSFTEKISEEIVDQPWFPLDWKKDQTISSMLVMLDAIQDKFSVVDGLWSRLKAGAISFYFLPIREMGLTDELYIKMNSRGKPLTLFEHFKAELERNLKRYDAKTAERVMSKIDRDWTDLLWAYRGNDSIIDDEFLRYFRFICDLLCYRSGNSPQGKSGDEFDLLNEYFSISNEELPQNIKTLEEIFDCWCQLKVETPAQFLGRFFAHTHEPGKVKNDTYNAIDIFGDCLSTYSEMVGGRNRKFPLNRFIILYAVIQYLLHRDAVTEEEFARRLRVVNNLCQNSQDDISDSENRSGGNKMPAILCQVDSIILRGVFDDSLGQNFNTFQIEEEKSKLTWCVQNPDKKELLFEIEDHPLLYGQIGILGLENYDLFQRFTSLFSCSWDAVDCALLSCGNYFQTESNGRKRQIGSKGIDAAWRNLFHHSAKISGFEQTKEVLTTLLNKKSAFTDDYLMGLATAYTLECEARQEYDWRYYYIKYSSFRPGRYGKYIWEDIQNKPYELMAMWTEVSWSSNSLQPFLQEIDSDSINRDDYGRSLLYEDKSVTCENDAFVVRDVQTKVEIGRLPICQNDEYIDVEDRIIKGKAQLAALVASCTLPAVSVKE